MSWSDQSAAWLQQAIADHPEMSKAELRRWCRANYPFGDRAGWAYKAWLKTLRAYFTPQAVRPARRADAALTPAELEALGQMRLLP